MERFLKSLHFATDIIEVAVSVFLVILAIAILVSLGVQFADVMMDGLAIDTSEFNQLIGLVLEVFIIVELFRIAIAYMKHENVIPTVLEAALVAVARKLVVFDGGTNYLTNALALSSLLLAVAFSWWLLAKSNACELRN